MRTFFSLVSKSGWRPSTPYHPHHSGFLTISPESGSLSIHFKGLCCCYYVNNRTVEGTFSKNAQNFSLGLYWMELRHTYMKTAFLLAIVSAIRVSEFHTLSVSHSCLRWKPDGFGVTLTKGRTKKNENYTYNWGSEHLATQNPCGFVRRICGNWCLGNIRRGALSPAHPGSQVTL